MHTDSDPPMMMIDLVYPPCKMVTYSPAWLVEAAQPSATIQPITIDCKRLIRSAD